MKKILLVALAAASVMGMMCSCNTDTTQDSAVPQSSIEISQTSSESSQESVSSEPSAENTDSEKKIDEIFTNFKNAFPNRFRYQTIHGGCHYAVTAGRQTLRQ